MNEYQDQEVWYEVQVLREGRWSSLADFDTYAEADGVTQFMNDNNDAGNRYRTKRVSGLPA